MENVYPPLIESLAKLVEEHDVIDPSLYVKYDVKRGLRDSDGKGVLVGLTQIGNVFGYEIKDGETVAVPGKLIYRGYDVEDIISDIEESEQFGFEQVIYLLLFGELPNASQIDEFDAILGENRELLEICVFPAGVRRKIGEQSGKFTRREFRRRQRPGGTCENFGGDPPFALIVAPQIEPPLVVEFHRGGRRGEERGEFRAAQQCAILLKIRTAENS